MARNFLLDIRAFTIVKKRVLRGIVVMENIRRKNNMIETYGILLMDLLGALGSFALAVFIRVQFGVDSVGTDDNIIAFDVILALCLLYTLLLDGNRNFFRRDKWKELRYTFRYTAIIVVGLVFVLFLMKRISPFSRAIFILFTIFDFLFTYALHMLFKKYMLEAYKKSINSSKMLILTNTAMADRVVKSLVDEKTYEYDVTSVAIYDDDRVGASICDVPVVAKKENLMETVIQMMVDEVFICLPGVPTIEIRELVEKFEEMGLTCHYNVDIFSHVSANTHVQKMAGYSVISFEKHSMDARRLVVKRLVDIIGALVGCILTLIITPFVALAIKIESPGPVFFSQTRIGKNGRRFKIWKFRSMYIDAEERKKALMAQNEMKGLMFKMDDDPRITKVGKFIRKTSIDETPQFFNILVGDMSLIGTRPPTVDEFEQYNGYYRRRLSITPGLTGMWQVSGRSDIQDFDEIVKLDLEYIDNWSLLMDIKILFKTVYTVLAGRGSK